MLRHPWQSACAARDELWKRRGVRVAWTTLVVAAHLLIAPAFAALVLYALAHPSK
jgi:hypothetical protein